jgi:hypothetical protein
MTDWHRPAGTAGDYTLVRASSVASRQNPRDCPTGKSAALRPLLKPDPRPPWGPAAFEGFTFAPFMDAVDLMEHQNWSLERAIEELNRSRGRFSSRRAPAHPALLQWTAELLPAYLAARESARQVPGSMTAPQKHEWVAMRHSPSGVPDSRRATHYEQTAWGRRYASSDGRYRDLWLPSIGRPRADRSEAELAAVAYVLAQGVLAPRPAFGEHYQPFAQQPPLPERVRVFGFGCTNAETLPLLDWDQQEVQQRYREHAAPALARAATGSRTIPGTSCIKCKAISSCTELPRTADLWGGTPAEVPRPRRSLSTWDLRVHAECPAQYHLTRQLKLTSLSPDPEAAVRGRLVDTRLNEQHDPDRPRPARGCREIPGPADPDPWSAGPHSLSGHHAREAAAMLAQHTRLCPLDGMGADEQVLVQQEITRYIPELDVVVFATPDLLYSRSGGWVWRETKTAASRLWEHEPLMRRYPQLALAVLLVAAGALGGDLRRSRVELELLYAEDSNREVLDPNRPEIVEEARQIISDLAEPLLHDTTYEAAPGKHCHGCDARLWCRRGIDHMAAHPLQATAAADPAPQN